MKTRQLGTNGYNLGEVGLGCWQFGGDFGDMTEATAFEIMANSVASGVTFFDTADVYGGGRSEALIGRFVKETGAKITVATKFGRAGNLFPDKFTRQALRDAIARSAERLQVEAIDLLQLHCIPTAALRDGRIFDHLREARQDGLIRQFGASVESVEEGLICLEQEGLQSLQVIFNIFRQKLVNELLPQAKAAGVGIIVRLPLASGLLAGKYTKATTFPATDHRNYNRDGQCFNVGETFAGLPFERGVELADRIKPLVPPGMTMAQLALRWILDHEAVSVIIPGANSPTQALANAAIADLPPLLDALHTALRDLYMTEVPQHIRGPY